MQTVGIANKIKFLIINIILTYTAWIICGSIFVVIILCIFSNTYAFYARHAEIITALYMEWTYIYHFLINTQNYHQLKCKVIAVNYVIAATANEIDSPKLEEYIQEKYENNEANDIKLKHIRKYANEDIWSNNNSFYSWITYCEYYDDCKTNGKPTKFEWKVSKFCIFIDLSVDVIIHLIPLTLIKYIVFDGLSIYNWQCILFFVFILFQGITFGVVMFKYWPFYYHIAQLLPFLHDREDYDISITEYNQQDAEILMDMERVYEAILMDSGIKEIIYQYVHPQGIAQTIVDFLRVEQLYDLLKVTRSLDRKSLSLTV